MKRLACLVVLALAALLASCGGDDEKSFAKADYNKDGKVVFEELIVAYPDLTMAEYESYDLDRGGALGEDEYNAFVEARASGKKPAPAQTAAPAAETPAAPAAETPAADAGSAIPEPPSAQTAPSADAGQPAAPEEVQVVEVNEALTMPEGGKAGDELVAVAEETAAAPKPEASQPAAGETTYELKRGDVLSRVASKFGVSLKALMEANGIDNPDKVEAGAKLVIPSGGNAESGAKTSGAAKSEKGKVASGPMAGKAELFVDGFLAKSAQDDVEGLVDMYADSVRFYKKGEVGKDFIRKDKMDYFTRWPVREYVKSGKTKVYDTDDANVKKVVFVSDYVVKNSQKNLSGQAEFTLLVRFNGDVGAIVAEDGKVLKRN